MDKVTRNILIGTGFVAVAGGLYLLFANRKDQGKGGGGLGGILNPKGKKFRMGYINNGYIHVYGDDRAEASKYLKKGTKIVIAGGNDDMNGERTISKLWIDANGKVGGFKTTEFTVGYHNNQDRTYDGKATIFVKSVD